MHPQVAAFATDPEIKDLLDVNYLRFEQREEHRQDIDEVESVLNDPARRKQVQNPSKLRQQTDLRKRNLERQTPPKLTGSQQDKLARLERVALSAFTENMPTREDMRHRPPGVVDHHEAWEKANKRTVILWKRTRLLLNPESRERDLCNIEIHRPSSTTRSLMGDALINRPFALSAEAKANFDGIDWQGPAGQRVNAEIQRLIDEGKIKVNYHARRGALRPQKDVGKVYECKHDGCGGRIFSGKFAKSNFQRHTERHILVGAEATA